MEQHHIYISISKPQTPHNPVFESEPLPISKDTLEWGSLKNVILKEISLFHDGKYIIHCKVGNTPWFQLELIYFNLDAGNNNNRIEHDNGLGAIILETSIVKHCGFMCANFKLNHIRLEYNAEKLSTFLKVEAKIRMVAVVQLREWSQSKQMSQHLIYLGRAQRISTKCNEQTRTYSWIASSLSSSSSFPGVKTKKEDDWEHHLQEYADMSRLKLKIPDTAYPSALTHRGDWNDNNKEQQADNDGFSNPFQVLPLPFNCENAPLFTFKFFNLALEHPARASVETSFKLTEAILSNQVSPNVDVQIENTQFGLTEIRLIVKNYQSTLLFLHHAEVTTI